MKDMPEKTAIIFIGIQASGKSTFYHERFEDYVHINLDTLLDLYYKSGHDK